MRSRVNRAIGMGAEEIASMARLRVPVNTGKLRDSIQAKRSGSSWKVVAGDRTAFYAAMVEFGTSHSAAQPYLIPAAEVGRAHLEELVVVVLRQL